MLDHKRILLLSAYDAASHRQWRLTLHSMFARSHWTCLTLPARYFSWRVRGNSLSWAFNHRRELTDNYDLIIATSLTDLASLRGFVPSLAGIPTLLYFHENQFAYPLGSAQSHSIEPAMVNLYSALCADHVAFNSEWNRSSFLHGVQALLDRLPDHVPSGLTQQLEQKSSVLPVPLPDSLFHHTSDAGAQEYVPDTHNCVNIVWNHRHEYDKGPELLLAIVQQLISTDEMPFRLHLLGQRFRKRPAAFEVLDELLQGYYLQQGISPGINAFISDRDDYLQQLAQSDIVLSTALHDFQGLSMLEAAAVGCYPIAPAALAYPEYLPADGLFQVAGLDVTAQAQGATRIIVRHAATLKRPQRSVPSSVLTRLSVSNLTTLWQNTLVGLLKSG